MIEDVHIIVHCLIPLATRICVVDNYCTTTSLFILSEEKLEFDFFFILKLIFIYVEAIGDLVEGLSILHF